MTKFGNIPTPRGGYKFASKKEAERYSQLLLLLAAGEISDLEVHPKYVLQPSFKVGKATRRKIEYVGDFRYRENGRVVVEDVKGWDERKREFRTTAVFDMKAKMLEYNYPEIELRIVAA